jgi:hypothetical protein
MAQLYNYAVPGDIGLVFDQSTTWGVMLKPPHEPLTNGDNHG